MGRRGVLAPADRIEAGGSVPSCPTIIQKGSGSSCVPALSSMTSEMCLPTIDVPTLFLYGDKDVRHL